MYFFTFNILERSHTLQHFIEIHLMSVELRTIYANEFRLTSHSDTARSAHTCTIYHDRIKRNIGRNFVFLGKQTNKFHHDSRTNGKTLIYLFTLDYLFNTFGHQTFLAIRTIIGHNNYFIRTFSHFFF